MPTDREMLQQSLDALESECDATKFGAAEALRARLAQPEQEAVAWLYKKKDGMQVITDDPDYADGTWTPLFTTPPQREFIGLTDEEIEKIIYSIRAETIGVVAPTHLARVIQQALREKNT